MKPFLLSVILLFCLPSHAQTTLDDYRRDVTEYSRRLKVAAAGSDAAAEAFFMQAGNLAARYGVRLAIEANPPMYTNYLNGTAEAFSLVKRLDNPGLAVNLDLSTMLAQGEKLQNFVDDLKYVSHVHISEPGLAPIQKRPEHKELALLLGAVGYRGFVSVEMARTDLDTVKRTLDYVAEVFQ